MPSVAISDSGSIEEPAPPAGDVEAVHDGGEALVKLARPLAAQEHGEVDARIEVEQHAA